LHLRPQHHHARLVRPGPCTNHEIDGWQRTKHVDSYDLPQPPFQPVSLHVRALVLRHDDTHARMRNGGSCCPEIEMLGPEALPPL
jgi:hypothetical protein